MNISWLAVNVMLHRAFTLMAPARWPHEEEPPCYAHSCMEFLWSDKLVSGYIIARESVQLMSNAFVRVSRLEKTKMVAQKMPMGDIRWLSTYVFRSNLTFMIRFGIINAR